MPSKLKALQETRESKALNYALMLCAIEVGVLVGAILLHMVFGHQFLLITRINAASWLLCGGGSIVLSIVGLTRVKTRSASISVFALCITIFILCAFRFALV
jgi:hypothetical protein